MFVDYEKILADISQLNMDGKIVLISGVIFLVTAICTVVNWILDIVHEFTGSKEITKSKYQYYNR
jgi:hypothetical protein